ncbi:MAG: oligosaccharide flippase family protein, partial [Tistlia sp.]
MITGLMRLLALMPMIQALESIRTVDLQKHLRFSADFRFNIAVKLASFCVTVGLAVWLQDYRALVWGMLSGSAARALISHLVAPHRPRLSLGHARELFGFSMWVLVSQLGEHATDLADRLIAGRLFGAETVGFYHVASEVAVAPARELTVSIARALQPVYARLTDDPAELGRKYAGVLGIIAAVSLAPSFGLALVADDAVALVLGDRWLASAPLIAWLAPAFALHFLTRTNYTVLHVLGYARRAAVLRWPLVAGIVLAMYLGGTHYGIEGVAAGRLAALLLFLPWPFLITGRLVSLGFGDYLGALWRPLAASGAMALAVWLGHQEQFPLVLRLVLDVALGALAYVAASLVLWRIAGRPEGAESFLLAQLRTRRAAST